MHSIIVDVVCCRKRLIVVEEVKINLKCLVDPTEGSKYAETCIIHQSGIKGRGRLGDKYWRVLALQMIKPLI